MTEGQPKKRTWKLIAPPGVELVAQPATSDLEAITGTGGVMYITGKSTRIWQNGGPPQYYMLVAGSDGNAHWVYDGFPPGWDDTRVTAQQARASRGTVELYYARHK